MRPQEDTRKVRKLLASFDVGYSVVVTFSKTENEIYKTKQMEKVSSFSLLDM